MIRKSTLLLLMLCACVALAQSPAKHFYASKKGKTFHHAFCFAGRNIKLVNLVKYESIALALADSLKPCRSCKPDECKH